MVLMLRGPQHGTLPGPSRFDEGDGIFILRGEHCKCSWAIPAEAGIQSFPKGKGARLSTLDSGSGAGMTFSYFMMPIQSA